MNDAHPIDLEDARRVAQLHRLALPVGTPGREVVARTIEQLADEVERLQGAQPAQQMGEAERFTSDLVEHGARLLAMSHYGGWERLTQTARGRLREQARELLASALALSAHTGAQKAVATQEPKP